MTSSTKNLDPAFQGVGHRAGTEIWRIENFQPVPLQKSEYGRFYSGDSYIVLQTIAGKGGSYLYDIHFWLGKDTSQDEAGTAAIKTVELDTVLGGRAVQHRELQGHESDKFLSYFKPCIVPLEGGVASGFRTNEEEKFETRLYICKGKRLVRLKQVPFVRSSLNHDDVFILDTENKIYQFNGANSNIQERAKALEVIQHLKEKYHEGTCEVAIVDDGKLVAESDSGEFWVLFGGFAPLGKKAVNEDDITPEATPGQLYSINDGQLQLEESTLSKGILENNKCYLLDCGSEIFIWVGRLTQLEERKAASKAAEEFIINENRPKTTCITQVIQGFETRSFKSKFEDWHAGSGAGTSGGEDGRGKVAALLKQQGVDVKGVAKGSVNEEVPALLEGGGKIEVWRINGSAKTSIPKEEIGKFYCGDCYIVLYTYHSGDKKDEYFLSCWLGKDSIEDDHMTSIQLANTMCASLKGKPVLGRFFQGKEPPQFIALFQPMVVLKGGVSSGYKDFIAEKNLNDETYVPDGIALLQISGTSTYNARAIQVDAIKDNFRNCISINPRYLKKDLDTRLKVATSLSSSSFFVLQSRNTLFIWQGNACAFEQQHWAAKVAEFLKPGGTLKHAKEGTESSAFWFALGGKKDYTSKKLAQDTAKDPHLYMFSLDKGKLEVTEVFNFSQDDLLTEDILILDTHAEVFVWVGNCVDPKEKQKAFEFGEKYIELAAALEGLSLDVPLYKVPERHEPCFFTAYFSWDSTKSSVQGNSFQKKLLLLFGTILNAPEHSRDNSGSSDQGPTQRASALAALSSAFNPSSASAKSSERSNAPNHGGPTQRASALAALSSAFNPPPGDKTGAPKPSRSIQGSQRAAAVAALSTVLTAEQLAAAAAAAASGRISRTSSLDAVLAEIEKIEDAGSDMGDPLEVSTEEGMGGGESMSESEPEIEIAIDQTFTYEQLRSKSSNPITGIDYKRREAYLSEEEFEVVMGMAKEVFYSQPKWKQNLQKREADLF